MKVAGVMPNGALVKPARKHCAREVEAALRAAAAARTPLQLRQCQAILIPALTGASLQVTAGIIGVSRNQVCVLRRQFRAAGGPPAAAAERRGGRRRSHMSLDDEVRFVAPWLARIASGADVPARDIRSAYECAVGRKVAKSTIYRLLARHGWRRGTDPETASL